jgi:cytochrome c553
MMKKILLTTASSVILTMSAFSVQADGASDYAALGCASCHGKAGKSAIPTYPKLSGQHAAYIVKQLKDFQSGARKDPTMNAMSALAVGKEQSIADYLSKQ